MAIICHKREELPDHREAIEELRVVRGPKAVPELCLPTYWRATVH